MTHHQSSVEDFVAIGREHWDVSLPIRLAAFLNFSRRMDCQLRHLTVRWMHAASPATRSLARKSRGNGGDFRTPIDDDSSAVPGTSPPFPSRIKENES
jgi:hypothetical protein